MSDHWEFFPCAMGEHQASIFYDHGIKDDIDNLPYQFVLRVRVKIKSPNEQGLTTNEEFDEISNLEDLLSDELEKVDCIAVGRVTVDGYRYFVFYTNTEEAKLRDIIDQVADKTQYEMGLLYKSDPEKSEYWENLFPTRDDMQVIQDMRVLDALTEAGDSLEIPRRIDHWAYFKSENDINQFSQWLVQEGFTIQDTNPPDDEVEDYSIQFYSTAKPSLREITSITLSLNAKAEELAGEYSGWETSVEKE